jgi:hypothetical protein
MSRNTVSASIRTTLAATVLIFAGCAADRVDAVRADQPAAPPAADPAPAAPDEKPVDVSADTSKEEPTADKSEELKKKRKSLRDDRRKLAKLERDQDVAQQSLQKAKLSLEHAESRNAAATAKADAELELARRKLEDFDNHGAPSRIAHAELSLQRATDNATEAEEELQQLEAMYNEDEFADQTKEIVLERARRRLERTRRDLELRRKDFETLSERTIPREHRELELAVVNKTEARKRTLENAETGMIDQRIALINAEGKIETLEQEMSDTRESIDETQRELEKMETAASAKTAESPA